MTPVALQIPAYPPLGVALIGSGSRGAAWLSVLTGPDAPALRVVLKAVCNMDPDGTAQVLHGAAFAGVVQVADLAATLALPVDIMIDATSPITRLATTRAALRAGCHVLCDPPLALDDATALALIGAAARAPGRLSVGYLSRHRAGLRQLRALAASGAMGRPRALRASLPFPEAMPLQRVLRDPAAEAFDAARAILGCDGRSVRCFGPPVQARFDMADGTTFDLTASAGPECWQLDLEQGSAICEGARPATMADGLTLLPVPLAQPDGHAGALSAFVAAIHAGRMSETGPRDAAASLAMALAAMHSAAHDGRFEKVLPLGLMSDASASPSPRATHAPRGIIQPDPAPRVP